MLNRSRRASILRLSRRPHLEVLEDRTQPSVLTLILEQAPPPVVQVIMQILERIESSFGSDTSDHSHESPPVSSNPTRQPSAIKNLLTKTVSSAPALVNDLVGNAVTGTTEQVVTQQAETDVDTITSISSNATGAAKSSPVSTVVSATSTPVASYTPIISGYTVAVASTLGAASSPNHLITNSATSAKTDTGVDTAQNDRAALADAWGVLAGQGVSPASSNVSSLPAATPARDTDLAAGRLFDVPGLSTDPRTPLSGSTDETEDAAVFARLESLNAIGFSMSDDGSLGAATALSQLTGRRAVVLPQKGSAVASVATLLGDDSITEASSTGAADERLNHLLINPLATGSSAATDTASQPADGSRETTEKTASGSRLVRSLLLLPLGWGLVQVHRLRKRKAEVH